MGKSLFSVSFVFLNGELRPAASIGNKFDNIHTGVESVVLNRPMLNACLLVIVRHDDLNFYDSPALCVREHHLICEFDATHLGQQIMK